MTKKTGLGKGLEALIPKGFEVEIESSQRDLVYIETKKIKPNELQPRKRFDKESLQSLAKSIERNGIIQPLLLRKLKKGYEIIAGERRWRASMIAELKEVPAIILNADDMQRYEMALVENIQRVQLNPIEEAIAFKELIEKYEVTHEQMSDIVGKSRVYVTNSIRLLALEEEVKEMLENSEISTGHAKLLISLLPEKQIQFSQRVVQRGLSVRELEKEIKNEDAPSRVSSKNEVDPEIRDISEKLMEKLGTRVNIVSKKTKRTFKGKIEIEFYSEDGFDEVLNVLGV